MKSLVNITYGPQKLGEKQLINRIVQGEKSLYELLMRNNNQKLYRVIAGYLKDPQDVRDIMQETYLKAYENLRHFQFKSGFSTWLIRIGINLALAKAKENGRFHFSPWNSNRLPSAFSGVGAFDENNPENILIQGEAVQILEWAIGQLKPKYRVVYLMREIEEMSIGEISDCLAIRSSNVKVRLHRAKKMLRANLKTEVQTKSVYELGYTRCDAIVASILAKIS